MQGLPGEEYLAHPPLSMLRPVESVEEYWDLFARYCELVDDKDVLTEDDRIEIVELAERLELWDKAFGAMVRSVREDGYDYDEWEDE